MRKIPSFTEVRWESLYELTATAVERFQTILITMSQSSQEDTNHALVCAGLFHKIHNAVFVEELIIFYKVMSLLQSLLKMLQKRSINWHQTCTEIRLTRRALSSMKDNQAFIQKVVVDCRKLCDATCIPWNSNLNNDLYETRISSSQVASAGHTDVNSTVEESPGTIGEEEVDGSTAEEEAPLNNNPTVERSTSEETSPEDIASVTAEDSTESIETPSHGNSSVIARVQAKVSRLVEIVLQFFDDRYPASTMKLLEGLDALDPTRSFIRNIHSTH